MKKKNQLLFFLTIAILTMGAVFLLNFLRESDGYTMRELGQEAVVIADEFLDGILTAEDARAIISTMLEAIDNHIEERRTPLEIRDTNIHSAIRRVHLDLMLPNHAQVRTSRNRLAELVSIPERAN